ncbi:ATP phosphoribosyltransferase [Nonlabens arenilitoris]|uniref:ATP phosphoribosyltransferase n=1 Tax=Nonlabens arenilitoris TaxID=1217969 RepID=A0A2S7U8I6_9FLAO|nr:ATP phosphoribosyltransferase [Nonlabens arenilitoris]PQJ30877.1 ATP phosphoribosyltransferase [Nonlabens arenilitoris]
MNKDTNSNEVNNKKQIPAFAGIRIAVQKSGRLSDKSLQLLKDCGIKFDNGGRKLSTQAKNFPMEILFLRDDDIPQYVANGVADLGILGLNEVEEKDQEVDVIKQLGFAGCRLSLAVQKDVNYTGLEWFNGKKVASSYTTIVKKFFADKGINATTEEIGGSVEIAPGIGLAEGICDIVSTGSTLIMNGLKEVETVMYSEAVLISNPNLSVEKKEILDKLTFRIDAVQNAQKSKYILLNAPNDKIEEISALLPGMKSPTVLPLAENGWSSLHSVIEENDFWNVIDQLKDAGAQGILVSPIEKLIA